MPGAYSDVAINAGELRRRVTLQKLTTALDETGEVIRTWDDVKTVWAKISPTTGNELSNAAQLYPEADTQFVMRYDPSFPVDQLMMDSWRIIDQWGAQYDIANVSDIDARHIRLEIYAKQRPAGRNA